MVLCRPFFIELEFGNAAFEEMEKRKYQEKKNATDQWNGVHQISTPSSGLRAFKCFH